MSSCHFVPGICGRRGSGSCAGSELGSPWAFSLSHVLFVLPQGVIDLEALGKKGYSVPKAGTIQVVSCSLISSNAVRRALFAPRVEYGPLHCLSGQQP